MLKNLFLYFHLNSLTESSFLILRDHSNMSLADELWADLESDGEQEETFDHGPIAGSDQVDADGDVAITEDQHTTSAPSVAATASAQTNLDDLLDKGEDVTAQDLMERFDFKHIDDVKSVSNLMLRLDPILKVCFFTNFSYFLLLT